MIVVHLPHKEWTPQMKNSLRRYMPYRGISIGIKFALLLLSILKISFGRYDDVDGAEYIRAYSCKDWLDAYTIANEIDPKHAGEVTILPLYHVLEQVGILFSSLLFCCLSLILSLLFLVSAFFFSASAFLR